MYLIKLQTRILCTHLFRPRPVLVLYIQFYIYVEMEVESCICKVRWITIQRETIWIFTQKNRIPCFAKTIWYSTNFTTNV